MRKVIFGITTAFAALLFVLNWIGYFETARDVFQHRGVLVSTVVTVLTSQWFSLCLFLLWIVALALIQWGTPEWLKKRAPIKIVLSPRWGAPILATVINNDRDYPAHVKRSTLYGIKKRGHREKLYDASKLGPALEAPYTIDPERRVEQAYGDIPLETFKFLQAEIELENGKIFVSKKAKSPAPPRGKHKSIESVAPESESLEEAEFKFKMESGPNVKASYSMNMWGPNLPVRFLHPVVLVNSGTVTNCKGYLTRIAKNSEEWVGQEQLTFSPSEAHDSLEKTLHHGIRYALDVLAITSDGAIHICNEKRQWRRWPALRDIFSETGDYFLTVAIVGDGVTAQNFTLRFDWTGNWQTSWLTLHQDLLLRSNQDNPTEEERWKPLEIEALPASPNLANKTQLGWKITGRPVFDADCILRIHNPNPTQGIDGVEFRLLSIQPALVSFRGFDPTTDDTKLRRLRFSFTDIDGKTLKGDQTGDNCVLAATRNFAAEEDLKNISIELGGTRRFCIWQLLYLHRLQERIPKQKLISIRRTRRIVTLSLSH